MGNNEKPDLEFRKTRSNLNFKSNFDTFSNLPLLLYSTTFCLQLCTECHCPLVLGLFALSEDSSPWGIAVTILSGPTTARHNSKTLWVLANLIQRF